MKIKNKSTEENGIWKCQTFVGISAYCGVDNVACHYARSLFDW